MYPQIKLRRRLHRVVSLFFPPAISLQKRHFYFGAVFQTRLKCVGGVGGGGIAVYGTAWPQDRPTDDDHNYQIFESERVKNDAGIDSLSRFVKGKKMLGTNRGQNIEIETVEKRFSFISFVDFDHS